MDSDTQRLIAETHVAEKVQLRTRIAELEAALDDLHMHAVEREYRWMMVPKVEWEQAFKRAKLHTK